VDPDGGIHRQRLRLEHNSKNSKPQYEVASHVEWPKDGWTCSLHEMPNFQHCFMFEYLAANLEKENQVRRGAFKSKRDGYALFKAAHVQKVQLNSTSHEEICFFESRVKASMTRNKSYRTNISLWKSSGKVRSGSCNCKGGAGGRCRHVGALLHTLLDFVESELAAIPQDVTCTEKPQQWNKPRSTVITSGALPIEDLLFKKHSYHDDKFHQKAFKRAQRSVDRRAFNATPSFALKVNESQIKTLRENLKSINTPSKPMIIDLLEGNNYKPAEISLITEMETRVKVHRDHYYGVPAKRKLHFDCDIPKKQCSEVQSKLAGDGPLLEPLESNFYNSSDLISHCETVQCQDFETHTPDLNLKCDSASDVKPEIDRSKHLILTTLTEESLFPDDTDLTASHFKVACPTFIHNLTISEEEIMKIESETRGQSQNDQWFQFRSGRVTASYFGEVRNRRSSTPPDRLVRDIFQYGKRRVSPPQCLEGQQLEPVIKEKYILRQTQMGHAGITVQGKGLLIDKNTPLLAASLDGEVNDLTAKHSTTGNLEMKYKQFPPKLESIIDPNSPKLLCVMADNMKGFCLENKNGILKLRTDHKHFEQIQGGMGVSGRPWSDFAVYILTTKVMKICTLKESTLIRFTGEISRKSFLIFVCLLLFQKC